MCLVIRHPGQIPLGGMRAGIQNDLIHNNSPGFRVSPGITVFCITPQPQAGGNREGNITLTSILCNIKDFGHSLGGGIGRRKGLKIP
jgi:hypothetical protein